jgi:hypothetical protein
MRTGLRVVAALAALGVAWLAREVLLLGFFAVVLAVVLLVPGQAARALPARGVAVVAVLLVGLGLVRRAGRRHRAHAHAAARAGRRDRAAGHPEGAPLARGPRAQGRRRASLPRAPASEGGGRRVAAAATATTSRPVAKLAEVGLSAAGGVVRTLVKLLLIVVLAAFLVYEPDVYRRGLRRLVPARARAGLRRLWTRLGSGLRHWVGGSCLDDPDGDV